ncbi:hypothetical protein Patl1_35141 [Pistacia atlantica]|uniref:Uncharacterized protein n=1 Tax=Pistacia atlantica TaxID=434234 RepID=A0ACC0ZXB9_9ROSI|nr:hypothetical protein Patl1_35141 [Pistacia atlantica]
MAISLNTTAHYTMQCIEILSHYGLWLNTAQSFLCFPRTYNSNNNNDYVFYYM